MFRWFSSLHCFESIIITWVPFHVGGILGTICKRRRVNERSWIVAATWYRTNTPLRRHTNTTSCESAQISVGKLIPCAQFRMLNFMGTGQWVHSDIAPNNVPSSWARNKNSSPATAKTYAVDGKFHFKFSHCRVAARHPATSTGNLQIPTISYRCDSVAMIRLDLYFSWKLCSRLNTFARSKCAPCTVLGDHFWQ